QSEEGGEQRARLAHCVDPRGPNAITILPLPKAALRLSMDARSELAARVRDIAPFHVMEVQTAARVLEAAGRSVIHMEIGEPDFPTPAPVLAEARRAIAQGGIYYTSALGLPELREAIAAHYADHYGVAVDAERVIVTAGSSAALLLVNALLVNRDDRILLADPG